MKSLKKTLLLLERRSGIASPTLAPSRFDGGTYFPEEETAPPAALRSGAAAEGPPRTEVQSNVGLL